MREKGRKNDNVIGKFGCEEKAAGCCSSSSSACVESGSIFNECPVLAVVVLMEFSRCFACGAMKLCLFDKAKEEWSAAHRITGKMADLEAVLADVSYLMAMEKSKCTPAARASKKIILPDPRWVNKVVNPPPPVLHKTICSVPCEMSKRKDVSPFIHDFSSFSSAIIYDNNNNYYYHRYRFDYALDPPILYPVRRNFVVFLAGTTTNDNNSFSNWGVRFENALSTQNWVFS